MIRAVFFGMFSIICLVMGIKTNITGEVISLVWFMGFVTCIFAGYFSLESWFEKNRDKIIGFPPIR